MLERPPPRDEGAPPSADSLAAEAERGADSYQNLPRRLARYGVAKERAVAMRDYLAGVSPQSRESQRAASELHNCGSYLVFRHFPASDRAALVGFRSCKQHLLCPLCAIRRGAKMLARYVERFQIVTNEQPELRAFMVTFTVKDGPDLEERFRHLQKALKTLHKRRHYPDITSEIQKVAGAIWSYEVKRGSSSGLWHPHVHAVYLATDEIDAARLAQEWYAITGDSFVLDVHEMYGEPIAAFCEVFKYAVKFGDLPLPDNWAAAQLLRKRRLVASFGCLFGVEIPDELTDEVSDDELDWIEELYRWERGAGYVFRGVTATSWDEHVIPSHDPLDSKMIIRRERRGVSGNVRE